MPGDRHQLQRAADLRGRRPADLLPGPARPARGRHGPRSDHDHGGTHPGAGEGSMSRAHWAGRVAGSPDRSHPPGRRAGGSRPRPLPRPVRTAIHGHHRRAAPRLAARRHAPANSGARREYQIAFGGGVHDGFRLPDDGALLPAVPPGGYALTSVAAADGQPRPADFIRTNHRLAATSHGTYPTGRHGFEISYRVTGAAQTTQPGWNVHVRLLDVFYSDGDRVEIRTTEISSTRLSLRCVTYRRTVSRVASSAGRR